MVIGGAGDLVVMVGGVNGDEKFQNTYRRVYTIDIIDKK